MARTSGQVHGRISYSLAEKLFDGSDAIRVTFSALTLMIHETAKVLNCKTVLEELSFNLESFVVSSPIRSHSCRPCRTLPPLVALSIEKRRISVF